MNKEIVDKFNLTKRDCDKFLSLVDFIEESRIKTGEMFDEFSYIRIPLDVISASEFTTSDIKKFSEIIDKPLLIIKDEHSFIDNPNDDLILRRDSFIPNLAKEKIALLKIHAEDETIPKKEIIREIVTQTIYKSPKNKRIKIFIKGDMVQLDDSDKEFSITGKRLEYLRKIASSSKPLKKKDLDPRPLKNFSTTIKAINKRIGKEFGFDPKKKVIVNPSRNGYKISDEYEVIIFPINQASL